MTIVLQTETASNSLPDLSSVTMDFRSSQPREDVRRSKQKSNKENKTGKHRRKKNRGPEGFICYRTEVLQDDEKDNAAGTE